jgi:predicted transcriptional regulator YdeE
MNMQPRFVDLPEKKVIGLGTKFISIMSPDKNNMTVIPKLWGQLMQQTGKITNRIENSWLGVVEQLPEGGEVA